MTDDPWKVLELDGSTAALADVKRSYARLLKLTRPDRDPEGFMRLRSAYEAAQAILRGEAPPRVLFRECLPRRVPATRRDASGLRVVRADPAAIVRPETACLPVNPAHTRP